MANEAFETRPANRPSRRLSSRSNILNSENANEIMNDDEATRKENDRLYRKLAAAAAANNSQSDSNVDTTRPIVPRPPAHMKPVDATRNGRRSRFSFKDPNSNHNGRQSPQPDTNAQRSSSKSRNMDQSDIIDLLHKTSMSSFIYFNSSAILISLFYPAITKRPLSSRLSKYTEPLPEIGKKINLRSHVHKSPSKDLAKHSISSSTTLSSATNEDPDDDYQSPMSRQLLIGLRLPSGKRVQKQFAANAKLLELVEFGLDECSESSDDDKDPNSYALLQMPNLLFQNLKYSLDDFKVENMSMFFLINKKNL